jgi:hypothetical protein
MTGREQNVPGPARGTQVRKDGEKWTSGKRSAPRGICAKWAPPDADGRSPAPPALLDRLEDHPDGRASAEMFERFAGERSLYG